MEIKKKNMKDEENDPHLNRFNTYDSVIWLKITPAMKNYQAINNNCVLLTKIQKKREC